MGRYVVFFQENTAFLDVSPSDTKNIQSGAPNSKKQESYEDFKRTAFFLHFPAKSGGIADELLT